MKYLNAEGDEFNGCGIGACPELGTAHIVMGKMGGHICFVPACKHHEKDLSVFGTMSIPGGSIFNLIRIQDDAENLQKSQNFLRTRGDS